MQENKIHISIVSPVYKAAELVDELIRQIAASVSEVSEHFEIILVEDGGMDGSWEKICENAAKFDYVKGVKLSRNFGQHRAITAGLDHCQGDWVVVMDCDLQDRPLEIPRLYNKASEGYDAVFAQRTTRQDRFLKKMFSRGFYRLLSYLTDTPQDPSIANFGIYHREVIDVVRNMREQTRYFPVMVRWAGFHTTTLEVIHASREIGKTTYSFGKALDLAINTMLAFSDKPLRLTIKFGLVLSSITFLIGIMIFIMALMGKIEIQGWASLIISVWFLSGMIILVLGMVGLYVGKAFEEVKKRPIYVVQQTAGIKRKELD